MTQEEKQLLLKDICARLPYGVKCLVNFDDGTKEIMTLKTGLPNSFGRWDFYNDNCSGCSNNFKPYLRPMSSMTEEERAEMGKAIQKDRIEPYGEIKNFGEDSLLLCTIRQSTNLQDWLNAHHFDYRGLIPMGLGLEAPKDMYKN